MIEAEVHSILRNYLRSQAEVRWPHHLTMARLIARALRLGRSALIQTGIPAWSMNPPYRLSYLLSVLVWSEPVIVVVPPSTLTEIIDDNLPNLRHRIQQAQSDLSLSKPIEVGDRWPGSNYKGVLFTTPQAWLKARLDKNSTAFPPDIPTIIDGADDLESWTREQLSVTISPQDWEALIQTQPNLADEIREIQDQLSRIIFQHPVNPYHCYLLEPAEQEILQQLYDELTQTASTGLDLPSSWIQFGCLWGDHPASIEQRSPDQLYWVKVNRSEGNFSLNRAPIDVAAALQPIWLQQPVVLIGEVLDLEKEASSYRQLLGLGELTCVKFTRDRTHQMIQLYLPSGLPMPNTPKFQASLMAELRTILSMSLSVSQLKVLLIDDVPLKAQISAQLASEFGSRVQVETTDLAGDGILVTGWEFWRQHQSQVSPPHLLAIATLPLPSLEHPLVAGRVAYHKRHRQDWFRLYLLPTALTQLQRAVAPVRSARGIVALFDNRVLYRSYGQQVLAALSPLARIDYLDQTLLMDQ
ncbi:MAG: ATP-dependent DNA helicase [Microcoleaceae cyanobacterium]